MLTMLPNTLLHILLISLVAGLGTGIGGAIAVIHSPGKRSFGFLMGITAGVMITLSFHELVNEAWELAGFWTATVGFAAGAFFMFFLDFMAPHIRFGEPEIRSKDPPIDQQFPGPQRGRHRFGQFQSQNHITDHRLLRTGLLLAVGITIHNIPEGIAVGAGFMHSPDFGLFIATAILLHNIPEGIATALPLCKSGVCRWDSFRAALLSGLAEPIGAVVAALFLSSFQNFVPGSLAFAGGVMMFITLDELIPAAREHGHHHTTALGIIFGAIFVFLLSGIFGV
jgi:zinc transporter, ZIP family